MKIHSTKDDGRYLEQAWVLLDFWNNGPREAAALHLALALADERVRGRRDGARLAACAVLFVNLIWVALAIYWSR